MSDSVRPHRWQPTRLLCPWDSPGKNTGLGCHFLFQCMKVKSAREVAQSCLTLHNPMDCSLPGSSIHGIFQARVLENISIKGKLGGLFPKAIHRRPSGQRKPIVSVLTNLERAGAIHLFCNSIRFITWKRVILARFRTGVINWPGKKVPRSGIRSSGYYV